MNLRSYAGRVSVFAQGESGPGMAASAVPGEAEGMVSAVLKQPKPRTCKAPGCERLFIRRRMGQKTCERYQCAIAYARAENERKERRRQLAERRERKAKLLELKPRSYWVRVAQSAFNAWVRERDRGDGCISCAMPATYQGQWHASHYRSTGAAPELRYDPDNVHKSCAQCNSRKSGNIVAYRWKLLEKIGPERVARLEGPHPPAKWTREDLQAIAVEYRAKKRELERARTA